MAPLPNTVHTILKSALKAARPEDWPEPPWHVGGAVRPVCPARGQITLALALAERLASTAPAAEQRQLGQLLAAVRQYLSGKVTADALRSLGARTPVPKSALGIAFNALGGCVTLARGKADLVNSSTQAAAAKAVALTAAGAPTRKLLETLDQEIICLECEAAFGQRATTRRVERVLWRGADSTARKTVHWVARLEGGAVAGSFKLLHGKGPAWVEGALDDVVALVPAGLFAEAVQQVSREVLKPTQRLEAAITA